MEWDGYIEALLSSDTLLDKIELCYDNESSYIVPIVRASVLMLENMISKQGRHNIFVFPEKKRSFREFVVAKTIFNIISGKIGKQYTPEKFIKGQMLKYKSSTFEFLEIKKDIDGFNKIYVEFSDMKYGLPISTAPYFQISQSQKKSSYKTFRKGFRAKNKFDVESITEDFIEILENYKTHLNSSLVVVSKKKDLKEFIENAQFQGHRVSDVLHVGEINDDGILSNITAGQLRGHPAIVIASDLLSVINAVKLNSINIQSMIVDISQPNAVCGHLQEFDRFCDSNFPIVCIADTANSFEIPELVKREYNLWRWDQNSITPSVISDNVNHYAKKLKNCCAQQINYKSIECKEISKAEELLYRHYKEINSESANIMSIYGRLYAVVFDGIRRAVPFEEIEKQTYLGILIDCGVVLEKERMYMSKELYRDLNDAINYLNSFFNNCSYKSNEKSNCIYNIIKSKNYEKVCIVIPERQSRNKYEQYWNTQFKSNEITVLYSKEYKTRMEHETYSLIIIPCWLNNKVMQQIIYDFSAPEYVILTYECEERWKRVYTKWRKVLDNCANETIIKEAFSKDIITSRAINHISQIPHTQSDDLEDLENSLRESRYERYKNNCKDNLVECFPVGFVGGLFSFYRTGHKVVTTTGIIAGTADKIEEKLPENIKEGDFIIVRETEHNIVKELADTMLLKEHKLELNQIALKWKDPLKLETELFGTSINELYSKLKDAGCVKGIQTVKMWINDEDIIMPNDKEDLLYIAKATGDSIIVEKLDEIVNAAREVRSVRQKAGRELSRRLKIKIVEYLACNKKIDLFNIWDPICLQIEDVGNVKILQVIDVGNGVWVDSVNTNKLLTE